MVTAAVVPPMNGGVVGSAEPVTFATMTPIAPAACAFCAFWMNEQRPRCTNAILPVRFVVMVSQPSAGSTPCSSLPSATVPETSKASVPKPAMPVGFTPAIAAGLSMVMVATLGPENTYICRRGGEPSAGTVALALLRPS